VGIGVASEGACRLGKACGQTPVLGLGEQQWGSAEWRHGMMGQHAEMVARA